MVAMNSIPQQDVANGKGQMEFYEPFHYFIKVGSHKAFSL
jgi:hypothetical protein